MTAPNLRGKALAYLRDGKVTVAHARSVPGELPPRPRRAIAQVLGAHGAYIIELVDGAWSCTCRHTGQGVCRHIAAASLVLGRPVRDVLPGRVAPAPSVQDDGGGPDTPPTARRRGVGGPTAESDLDMPDESDPAADDAPASPDDASTAGATGGRGEAPPAAPETVENPEPPAEPEPEPMVTPAQWARIMSLLPAPLRADQPARLHTISTIVGRPITHGSKLTHTEADHLIHELDPTPPLPEQDT